MKGIKEVRRIKNNKIPLSVIVIAVLIVFAVSTVSASLPINAVYFVPQHGTISGGPCNNITVDVWVNTTSGFDNWQTDIAFDPTCINITNVTYPTTGGWMMSGFGHFDTYIRMSNMRISCTSENPELLATLTIHCEAWDCTSPLNFTGTHFVKCMATEITLDWQNGTVTNEALSKPFDTGPGTYPSIMGVHKGNFTPKCDIEVRQIYTYPCKGTGGHSERVIFYDGEDEIINVSWNGYQGDYHNTTVSPPVTLSAGKEYDYKIITGSYPQIIHNQTYANGCGTITCTEFKDANGKRYNDWIPAIILV